MPLDKDWLMGDPWICGKGRISNPSLRNSGGLQDLDKYAHAGDDDASKNE